MKTREWKWEDVRARLQTMGVTREAVDCRKKWDNLMQQFKKVHKFQNLSGGKDYFKLASKARRSEGFSFVMDRSVHDEMEAMTKGDHTIHPKNLAVTGAAGGVHMPAGAGAGGDTMGSEGGGEATDEEQGSTKDSTFSAGSGYGYGKRKNMRQQTFEAVAEEVVIDVGDEDDEPLESHRKRNVTQGATATTIRIRGATEERPPQGGLPSTLSQPRPCNTAAKGGSMERGGGEGAQQEERVASGVVIAGATAGSSSNVAAVARAREELAVVEREVTRGDNKGEREDEDRLLSRVRRGGMAKDVAECDRLWVDDKAFWTTGEGRRLYNIVHETREYFVAIASGLPAPTVSRSVVMPKSATTLTRIADPSRLQQAIFRATTTENISLRVLHRWVFKSGNRPRGYNLAFQYALESVATDIACVMWYGEEWSNVVSAAVCVHTIDLNMDLPLWFAAANIEDRPEDDDMAAHQESTVICISHACRVALQMGGNVNDEFISHDLLSRIVDCFRLLWLPVCG
ncbi:hypothetical protein CBR_g66685 [Chara braunii]|uniref:Myb/SANT-like DNA-binding domain-containing protein n=1 Tax=Chara braunii TaxID=69332 RepID=A0A388JQ32_CHABU|nr:hypothetical protein CBR_g66685 [Chara braunii]|eukprot:GBG59878.1 hypothetical protein CBR_g66685 [Chara braunii]